MRTRRYPTRPRHTVAAARLIRTSQSGDSAIQAYREGRLYRSTEPDAPAGHRVWDVNPARPSSVWWVKPTSAGC